MERPTTTTPPKNRAVCEKCLQECSYSVADGKETSLCCHSPVLILPQRTADPLTCPHMKFTASVRCDRHADDKGVVQFAAQLTVLCEQCKSPMSFIGGEIGHGLVDRPFVDQLGLTLTAPMRPGLDLLRSFLEERKPQPGSLAGGPPQS